MEYYSPSKGKGFCARRAAAKADATAAHRCTFLKVILLVFLLAALGTLSPAVASDEGAFERALSPQNGPQILLEGIALDDAVPTPGEFLGYEFCSRPTHSETINAFLRRLEDASQRIRVVTYGSTHEGRELCYAIISSEENLARLDEIKLSISRLADPRQVSEAEARGLVSAMPAVAWLEFSIHGDELSGVEAALFLSYYLVAAEDSTTRQIRDKAVVIVDANQNPDGRERFLALLSQWASTSPNSDIQSAEHSSFWPWGRGNHYLFDLNRDWIPFLHPETSSRASAILEWHPQLVVDAHEMGAFESFLFSPPREPFNPNVTASLKKWLDVFGKDQAEAFDRFGWAYYTAEWNEEWGPFYANVWASHTGAIGILYEQAGVEGTAVRRPDGTYLGYPESVLHHVVSSIANLTTLANHREEILRDFHGEKRKFLNAAGGKAYVVAPGKNESRMCELVRLLGKHGIEVYRASGEISARDLTDPRGRKQKSAKFPPGTCVIPLAQPMGSLLKTIFEFDPRMTTSFLEEERHELERHGDTKLYEVTAWSVPLAFDLEIYEAGSYGQATLEKVGECVQGTGVVKNRDATYGFLVDYSDDAALRALPKLFEKGYKVRVATEPFSIDGLEFNRGALLVTVAGNPHGLPSVLEEVAASTGASFYGVSTAWAEEGPDLGGNYFRLLEVPRIAAVTGPGLDVSAFGLTWYLLDKEYGYRFSTLDVNRLGEIDLEKYNVLILPPVWGSHEKYFDVLGKKTVAKLKRWVENQGTLICLGTASAFAADTLSGLSKVRLRRQSLGLLDEFEEALAREIAMKEKKLVDSLAVWEGKTEKAARTKEAKKPGSRREETAAGKQVTEQDDGKAATQGKPDLERLKREDEWLRRFLPRGAIMNADLDQEHWLTFGMGATVPIILYSEYALLSKFPVETACRLAATEDLRLGGLVWPEGRGRWARTAYATREGLGRGQVILFAGHPYFRGYFHGSGRMLANAMFLGPGLGTSVTVPW